MSHCMRAARRGLVLFTCVAALSPLLNVHADAAHAATVVRYDADLSVSIPSRSITGRVVLTAVAVEMILAGLKRYFLGDL